MSRPLKTVDKHVRSRVEAERRGEVRYYTGVPCPRGHKVERYAGNGRCVECDRKLRSVRAVRQRRAAESRLSTPAHAANDLLGALNRIAGPR